MSREKEIDRELSVRVVIGEPENTTDLLCKYGTYNVQSNNGTQNEFPQIAQGLPEAQSNVKFDKGDVNAQG